MPDFTSLKEKYMIKKPYFIVPNQFWAHKNHVIILEALNILKAQGQPVTFIATGNTSDYRQPDYFETLQQKIQDYRISENFIVAGIVPYKELLQLMTHAIAVINPSLFEGWSTSIEEAKALNLKVILSDIPVHREQNPEKAQFFPPDDPQQLADLLLASSIEYQHEARHEKYEINFENLERQKREFAQNYEKNILDTLTGFRNK